VKCSGGNRGVLKINCAPIKQDPIRIRLGRRLPESVSSLCSLEWTRERERNSAPPALLCVGAELAMHECPPYRIGKLGVK
jgi:hypothetical protein